ncbi:MAG: TIM barrel protein [Candidatus Woesearchaeota archaeon]
MVRDYTEDFDYNSSEDIEEPIFGIRTIGTTTRIDGTQGNPAEQIAANIRQGAGNIEVQASGSGNGRRPQQMAFDNITLEEREAIRELARINKVNITTHADFMQVGNLNGLTREGYSEQKRQQDINELKKAIDFAADAANGGSVVVHTGEYQRGLEGNKTINADGFEFKMYEGEEADNVTGFVDKETGKLINLQNKTEVFLGKERKDDNGNIVYLKDQNGNYVYDDVIQRDLIDRFKREHPTEKQLSDEQIWEQKISEKQKENAKIAEYETDEYGNIQTTPIRFDEFKKDQMKFGKSESEAGQEFLNKYYYKQLQQSLGQAREFEKSYNDSLKNREKIIESLKFYQKIRDSVSDEEWEKYKKQSPEFRFDTTNIITPPEQKDPIEYLKKQLADNQRDILQGREAASSGRVQAREILKNIHNVESAHDYAIKKSSETMADLGVYALERTQVAKAKRPNDKIKPIAITLENIFPEMGYGSHPMELKNLIDSGRKAMAEKLQQSNVHQMSKKEAEKAAADHIRATLDTGHLNMWRKHFQPKDGETKEDTDKRFQKWFNSQVEELAKDGYIGNVHLADNLGYDDTHLGAGQGTAPLKDTLKALKKAGYDEFITSEGGFGMGPKGVGEVGMWGTWKLAGSSIYGKMGDAGTKSWTNPGSRMYAVHEGYLGVPNKPNFIFKGYAPDNEDWQPWSGTTME